MSKKNLIAILSLTGVLAFTSCGVSPTGNTTNSTATNNSGIGGILGGLGQMATNSDNTTTTESTVNKGSVISGVIGMLTGNLTTATSIEGTWTYTEPTVQFESENLLAKAGGVVAGKEIVNKLSPYYNKAGIKAGVLSFTFNADKTCTYVINGKTYNGTYEYNKSKHTLTITSSLGIKLLTAYATVSPNNLALTFDSSKLLAVASLIGNSSSNTTTSLISELAGSYDGMKMGFLFKKN